MSSIAPHVSGLAAVAVDCADPERLSGWWQGLLGGRIVVDESGDCELHADGWPRLDFLRVPDEKVVKNRLHLDLATTDHDRAVEQALAHGASPAPDVYDGDRWTTLRDPEGNEFCLLRPRTSLTGRCS